MPVFYAMKMSPHHLLTWEDDSGSDADLLSDCVSNNETLFSLSDVAYLFAFINCSVL